MTSQLGVRAMRPADARAAAALVRESFPASLHPYLVYCQPGTDAYFRVIVTHRALFPQHDLLVAEDRGDVIGFAEFRRLDERRALLSYVAVTSAERGRGIASRLISAYVAGAGQLHEQIELDVFQDNERARRLYERLGFRPSSQSVWWARDIQGGISDGPAVDLADAHGSLAALTRYGFCRMPARFRGRNVDLGLVSSTVLRVPDEGAYMDDGLLQSAARVLPLLRRVLLVRPGDDPAPVGSEVLLRSSRLHVGRAALERAVA